MFSREQFTNWCKSFVFPKSAASLQPDGLDALERKSRWIIRADIPNLVALDEAANVRSWDAEQFISTLKGGNSTGHILELCDSGRVIGCILYEIHANHYEITKFVVHPEFRNSGVANDLLRILKNKLSVDRRPLINAIVDEYDTATQQLLWAAGFRATGVMQGYFESLFETSDGYVFKYSVTDKKA
jgi:ribosomal protein S18 acetylase RimI-like enzyme